jgi:hypothetical protein
MNAVVMVMNMRGWMPIWEFGLLNSGVYIFGGEAIFVFQSPTFLEELLINRQHIGV